MRDKEYRLKQTERYIVKRLKQYKAVSPNSELTYPHRLDNHSALQCPDGRYCMICHPHKNGGSTRNLSRQEILIKLEFEEDTSGD